MHKLLRTLAALAPAPQRTPVDELPLEAFGVGLERSFSWFLSRPSRIEVRSLDEMLGWTAACRYSTDQLLFGVPDYWQHPCEFEERRAGDCEDFALWIWRKAIRNGLEAELVVGDVRAGGESHDHAWVTLHQGGDETIVDPCTQFAPCGAATQWAYRPAVSVGGDLQLYRYQRSWPLPTPGALIGRLRGR